MADSNKRPIIVVEGAAEWIVTYGDMMSLLLTFFIMLFSMSTLEVVKFQAAAESLQQQFGYSETPTSMVPDGKKGNSNKDAIRAIGRAKRKDLLKGGNPVKAPVGENATVKTLRPNAPPNVAGIIPFEIGSDQIDQDAKDAIAIIAPQLLGSPNKIEIRGHTAPREKGIYTRNNWDLGYARAFNVMQYIMSEFGIPEKNMRISTTAQFEPPPVSLGLAGGDPTAHMSFVQIFMTEEPISSLQGDAAEMNGRFSE